MFRYLISGLVLILVFTGIFILAERLFRLKTKTSLYSGQTQAKPLEKYSYPNLRSRNYPGSQINLEKVIKEMGDYTAYLFSFTSDGRKVTGQTNIPKRSVKGSPKDKFPVLVMFRGYIDKENYITGDGTRRAADYFASHDFITLAPDFLGFGQSDPEDLEPLASRFQTYITAINLINSISSLPQARGDQIFLWGHSNGGQVALSVLEISGKNYPAALWAPVSKPFPYSILFYSDEASDSGKLLRKIVAGFDRNYEADEYSLTGYLDWLEAPLLLQQGGEDDIVLPRWSREFAQKLKAHNKKIEYVEYPGNDHNFSRGSWKQATAEDLAFYKSFLNSAGRK